MIAIINLPAIAGGQKKGPAKGRRNVRKTAAEFHGERVAKKTPQNTKTKRKAKEQSVQNQYIHSVSATQTFALLPGQAIHC